MTLDQKLKDTQYIKAHSWGKILTYLKRQFDEWACSRLNANGYKNFKMAYMPVLMNIQLEGTNNNDLARTARVSKQAMSKVAKELQELGYIKTKTDLKDKRSTIFLLTDKGKKLVIDARLAVEALMNEYRAAFGQKEYDNTLTMLEKIIAYTDKKLSAEDE
jgi:DNA-binding MarR family transcriptional regulator